MTATGARGSSRTAETIDDAGWIHTGDLGYLDEDGYLFLGGRAGDMIIRGGENVAPEEVEAVLYEHPDVVEAGVVGVRRRGVGRAGGGGRRAPSRQRARRGRRCSEFCREHLAAFKRPDTIVFLEQLPRTSTGKLLRRELPPLSRPGVAPQTRMCSNPRRPWGMGGSMAEQPHALVERDGHTLIVTMNRPEARNALSGEMLAIMADAWDEVNANPDIRVAILTGAGGAFCAGADLKAMTRQHPGDSFERATPTATAPTCRSSSRCSRASA